AESRIALGVTDAAELPVSPGHGYLKVGTGPLRRFKAAYVSGPYRASEAGSMSKSQRIYPYASAYIAPADAGTEAPDVPGPSLMDVISGRLAGQNPPAHRVWLPPLTEAPAIATLPGRLVRDPHRER